MGKPDSYCGPSIKKVPMEQVCCEEDKAMTKFSYRSVSIAAATCAAAVGLPASRASAAPACAAGTTVMDRILQTMVGSRVTMKGDLGHHE